MSVITLTKDNFKEEVVLYEGRVLLDFYADWCAPCRMLAPAIDKFDAKNGGEIKIGKINIDKEDFLAHLYNINAVPTLISIDKGEIIQKSVGLIPQHMLDKIFDPV